MTPPDARVDERAAGTRVTLLGDVGITGPGGTVHADCLPGPQAKTAFAYLVLHHDAGVPIDRLGGIVWSGTRPATWRPALRALVSRIRVFVTEAAPTATITAGPTGYVLCLPRPVEVDLERARHCTTTAERALAAGDLSRALEHAAVARELSRRPFLPRSRSAWVRRVAGELDGLQLRALHTLGEVHVAEGEPARAARLADEAIELAPLHEASHRLAMRALVAAGETAEAALAFDRCRRLLAEELGIDPSPETTTLFTEILRH